MPAKLSFHPPSLRLLMTAGLLLAFTMPTFAARKARAIFVRPGENALEKAELFTGTQYAQIELPQRNLSPEVELPDGDLTLAILPKPLAEGAEVPPGTPTVKIPKDWTRCILIFFPDPSNPVFPARVIPANASTNHFPKGNTLVYNVSNAAILGKFGKEIVKIKPGGSGSFKPPIPKFGSYEIAVDCMLPGADKPTAVSRTWGQHDPEVRQILFITPQVGHKVPRIWGVLDREVLPESKAP